MNPTFGSNLVRETPDYSKKNKKTGARDLVVLVVFVLGFLTYTHVMTYLIGETNGHGDGFDQGYAAGKINRECQKVWWMGDDEQR